MERDYNLTVEELIVVLTELGKIGEAKSLIEALDQLGTPENLAITLKVATRSLISKGVLDVIDDEYVFEPLFKEIIETYLVAEKTLRVSKVYGDAEHVILVYKSEMGIYITHSIREFIFNFVAYNDYLKLMDDLVKFSNVREGKQILETPQVIKNDIVTVLMESEPEKYEEVLLNNDIPQQLIPTLLEDHTNVEMAHAYVIFDETLQVVNPTLILQSPTRSWISYEKDQHVEIESFTAEKLKVYLAENFFNGE